MEEKQFGDWLVNEKGDISSDIHNIKLDSKMLARSNIIEYLIDENINLNDFLRAQVYACKIKKMKSFTFNLS
jgi:hypothetical protein